MTAEPKTIEQLTAEIGNLRQQVAELETWKSRHEWVLEAYKQSEFKFKSLAEYSVAGVCIIQDGLFKYANTKMAKIFGYTVDELIDKVPAKTLVLDEDWPVVEENIRLRICGKTEAIAYQFSGIRKDGEIIRVDVHGSCVDHEGAPAVMGTLLDITQRIKTEAELEKEVNKLRALYDLALAMTADNNLNENLLMVVDQSRKLLGFDASYIALRDEQAGDVYMHTLSGITTEAFKKMRLPFGSGLGGKVAATQKGLVISDYFQEVKSPVHDVVRAEGLISGIAVPIQIGQTNLGVLYGFNRAKTSFSKSDLDTLFLIGNLAAVEITHKRQKIDLLQARDDLDQKVQDRTATLSATNERLKKEIVHREKAEDALRGSEAMLKRVLSTSPVGIGLAEGRIMKWANEAWLEMFGFENEGEVVGQSARIIYPSDAEYERVGQILYESLQTGRVTAADATFKRKDGSLIDGHIRMKAYGLSDLNTGSLAVITDISERKRVERALRDSEERYRALAENSLTGICVHQDGVHVYVNERFAKDLGYSTDELIGKPVVEVVAPQDREMVEQRWLGRLAGEKVPNQYQLRSLKKDGTVTWREVWATVIEHNGSPATLANVIDITKRKQAEDSLRALSDFRQTLIDSIPNPVFYKDVGGNYIGCNEAFAALLELPREDVVGRSVYEVVPKDLADVWREKDQEIFDGPHVQVYECTLARPDGTERSLVFHKAPIFDADGTLAGLIGVVVDITDRKSMERALRESEERYRALVENSLTGICVHQDGRFVYVNDRYANNLGFTADELIGTPLLDIVAPEDRDLVRDRRRAQLARDRIPFQIELRHLSKDGNIRWLEVWATGIDHDGSPAVLANVIDITKRKQAEDSLRALLDFRQTLIESIPNPVFYKDSNRKYMGCNEAFAALLGLAKEEVVGKSVYEVVSKEVANVWNEKDQELIDRPHVQVYEFTSLGLDGTERTFVNHKAPFFDADGRLAGLIGVMVDITDRKSVERALRESEERYRAIFNNAAVGIFVTDRYGKFIQANSAALKTLGYTSQEFESVSFSDITHPDDVEISRNNFGALIRGEVDSYRIEKRYIRKDGEIAWVDLSVSAIVDEKGVCVATFGMTVDITERKRAELERKSLREQLLQAQKMEAIGTLAGGIAHDFNNMLTIILGYSELIQSETDAQDPRSADLAKIVQTATNGADLVRRLLTFSRKADVESGPLELNSEIERTRKLLERTLPKMIDIRSNLEAKLALIKADPIQIDQVLMNLAINARDAMPDGGRLIIETKNVTLDEDYCSTHMGVMPGEYVMLSISDTGHGMDELTRARVFEPFFTTKDRDTAKGTGLGLAVVHGIVEQHGGHIICESEPDKGSTFRIYFPAVDRVTTPKESVVKPLSDGRGETLLLVDDEEFVRDLGKRILTRAGYKVLTASNGKEALEIYGEAQGEINLVILDLLMPEMGGEECLRELLRIEPELKVIVASGFSSDTSVDESAELGAKAFVSKPFKIEELLHQVRRILDER